MGVGISMLFHEGETGVPAIGSSSYNCADVNKSDGGTLNSGKGSDL